MRRDVEFMVATPLILIMKMGYVNPKERNFFYAADVSGWERPHHKHKLWNRKEKGFETWEHLEWNLWGRKQMSTFVMIKKFCRIFQTAIWGFGLEFGCDFFLYLMIKSKLFQKKKNLKNEKSMLWPTAATYKHSGGRIGKRKCWL